MKIVVCSLAINDWYKEIVKYSLKNMKQYCEKHDYICVIEDETTPNCVYNTTRAPCWFKIKLITKILTEHNDCDYVTWIDADCQILKSDIKLEYLIDKYFNDDIDITLTQDNEVLNTGFMIIKNTQFTLDLMNKIWDNPSVSDFFNDFHEQSSFANIYISDHDVQKRVKIIPYGIKDELITYWGNYYPGKHFLIHCARCSNNHLSFMYMMDMYYPYKLDEETDEEYKDRFEWFNNINMCRKDIDAWLRNEYVARRYSARCKKLFNV